MTAKRRDDGLGIARESVSAARWAGRSCIRASCSTIGGVPGDDRLTRHAEAPFFSFVPTRPDAARRLISRRWHRRPCNDEVARLRCARRSAAQRRSLFPRSFSRVGRLNVTSVELPKPTDPCWPLSTMSTQDPLPPEKISIGSRSDFQGLAQPHDFRPAISSRKYDSRGDYVSDQSFIAYATLAAETTRSIALAIVRYLYAFPARCRAMPLRLGYTDRRSSSEADTSASSDCYRKWASRTIANLMHGHNA
jgi:hypothetical protein